MTRTARRRLYLFGAVLLVVALVGGRWVAVETAERAWDRSFPGGEALIATRALAHLLQAIVLVVAVGWFTGNLLVLYRAIGSVQMPRRLGDLEFVEAVPRRVLFGGTLVAGVGLGVLFSFGTGDWWRHAVLAASPPRFGMSDGALGHDAGYYLSVLPWRAVLQNRALVMCASATGIVALLYGVIGSLRFRRGRLRASDYARAHCGVLLAVVAGVIAWGAALDPAEVVAGFHGTVDQAALTVRLPGAALVVAVAILTALISLAWAWRERPNIILAGWAALLLTVGAVYFVVPGVVRASVNPENGALTRRRVAVERVAFGLVGLEEGTPTAFPSAEMAVRRLPLWDAHYVSLALGVPQVAVKLHVPPASAADPPDRPAEWLIAPTAPAVQMRIAAETDTGLAVRSLPRTDSILLYGPGLEGFVLASDSTPPAPPGIPIDGAWRRFALAWTIQAWGLMRNESDDRILLWRRDVSERLQRLAPFAQFGAPAPAIRSGALWWVSWGYVSHEAFPLARPLEWRDGSVRYLRAGVVGAVRAGTGETHLWLAPGYDSLTAVWARRFTPLIEPADRLPADLRAQLAYPAEAFDVAVVQLLRASAEPGAADAAWFARPRRAFQMVAPGAELWTGIGFESGPAPKQLIGLFSSAATASGPRLVFWRPPSRATRLPGEVVGSYMLRPGQERIWPVAGSVVTVQAQFVDPLGTQQPPPRIADVFVTFADRSGRGPTARAALQGGEHVVADTSFAARWDRARRLAVQADSALGAGDLELFGKLWRALMRELAPARRPR